MSKIDPKGGGVAQRIDDCIDVHRLPSPPTTMLVCSRKFVSGPSNWLQHHNKLISVFEPDIELILHTNRYQL